MSAQPLVARLVARRSYRPRRYPATPVPTARERHLMNRLGCGWSTGTWEQMRAAGGSEAWLEQQMAPASVPESALVDSLPEWFPQLHLDPPAKFDLHDRGVRLAWQDGRDLGAWATLRRIHSGRPVLETMVDFWSNHLHIPVEGGLWFANRFDYDATIRAHALGRYEDLLIACTLHPSMLVYLDNFRSVRNAPNENHGRELLELHTLGPASGYTEAMVKDAARVLSGWTLGFKTDWLQRYDTAMHTTGPVQVLGFADPNAARDGRDLTVRFLRYLANHRATALTVARKMAVRFVSDSPSDALVNGLADVYLSSGTDIKAMLRHLVATEEFRTSAGGKVRTPVDDLVATARVLGVTVAPPTRRDSFGNAVAYLHQGLPLYTWPRPDGAPERNRDWASASRMLGSFRMHWNLAGGYHPRSDVRYRPARSWLPAKRLRLDEYVDHLCRVLLGRLSTWRDLRAVCEATGLAPDEVVTRTHPLADWMFPRLAVVLLDSPTHMSR